MSISTMIIMSGSVVYLMEFDIGEASGIRSIQALIETNATTTQSAVSLATHTTSELFPGKSLYRQFTVIVAIEAQFTRTANDTSA